MVEKTVDILNADGQGDFVLVCEHASNYIPPVFDQLGLKESATEAHIAWDPGARSVADFLSEKLNSPLVVSCVSRLIYDCNRPPEAESAVPTTSAGIEIPGNMGLDEGARQARTGFVYEPFRDALAGIVEGDDTAILVTIHSFTPVYQGVARSTELGIIHDSDDRLAEALARVLKEETEYKIRLNDPYGPEDGVTHNLKLHGVANRLLNVMIEIRNDLISSDVEARLMAEVLAKALKRAVKDVRGRGQ